VRVESFDDLLVNFVSSKNAKFVIRGLRAVSDFEYEFQLASANRRLDNNVETIFLTPLEANYFISSSLVREISYYQGDISSFVPEHVEDALAKKWAATKSQDD
jgi:pantetheine-phosphate adenylyltransferase